MTTLYPIYEAIPVEILAELCAIYLFSGNVSISPWVLRRTFTPEKYEENDLRERLLRLADVEGIGLTKCGKSLTLFSTKKSFVLFMANQCNLLSEESRKIPDFIYYGKEEIKKCFIKGLVTRLYIDPLSKKEGVSVETKFCSLASQLKDLFLSIGLETFMLFKKCDGKRVKYDKYVVVFFSSDIKPDYI